MSEVEAEANLSIQVCFETCVARILGVSATVQSLQLERGGRRYVRTKLCEECLRFGASLRCVMQSSRTMHTLRSANCAYSP
jgi:hypothetical protein